MLWGLTFVAVKDAVASIPVFTFLSLRFGLAALTLAALVTWQGARRRRAEFGRHAGIPSYGCRGGAGRGDEDGVAPVTERPTAQTARLGLLTGVLLFTGYALQTLGLQYTTPGKAGFITGLSVVLVPVLDALAFRRPQDRVALVGVALAAAGMALMFVEPADLSVRHGDLLVLGCALAFGAHVTAVAHFGRRVDPVNFTLWQVVAVVALSAAAATLQGWRLDGVDRREVVGTLLLTGPVVSGLLLVLQVWGQRHTSATHAALIFATEPIFAAIGGVTLAGEHFGSRTAAGAALILTGMVVAEAGRVWGGAAEKEGLQATSRTP